MLVGGGGNSEVHCGRRKGEKATWTRLDEDAIVTLLFEYGAQMFKIENDDSDE